MRQEAFEARYGPLWADLDRWLRTVSTNRAAANDDPRLAETGRAFPGLYRQICHHLALARTRRYSLGLQERLNRLALEGHRHLYRERSALSGALLALAGHRFPSAFRRHWRHMLAASLLFVVSAAGMGFAVQLRADLVYSLLQPDEVSGIEAMYDPGNRVLGRERESDTDVAMFGYYIYNNISIGFRTFAGGLLFGVGSVFFLCFNGLFLGAVASHLTTVGFGETFWPFVAGHSALELTAIVIFGGVGLMIGFAAVAPGRKRRWHAIHDRAVEALPLVYGATAMLVGAAFIEAFWSSTAWPPASVKIAVGSTLWLLLFVYLWLCGREP